MHRGELAGQGRAEQVSSLRTEAAEHRKSKTSHGQRNHLRKGLYLVGLVMGMMGVSWEQQGWILPAVSSM